jgi:hypothetical protein
VNGNDAESMARESFFCLKEKSMLAPLSSIDVTFANTCHDADASMSGNEKSEGSHRPHATEARTHCISWRFSGMLETVIANDDGTMHLWIEETKKLVDSDWLVESVQFEDDVKVDVP